MWAQEQQKCAWRAVSNVTSSFLLPIPGKQPAENPFADGTVVEQCVLTECTAVFSSQRTDANLSGVVTGQKWLLAVLRVLSQYSVCSATGWIVPPEPKGSARSVQFSVGFHLFFPLSFLFLFFLFRTRGEGCPRRVEMSLLTIFLIDFCVAVSKLYSWRDWDCKGR